MDAARRQLVRERAANLCEYCRLPQGSYDLTFHVEHIVAQQHQPNDTLSNLALACDQCNLHKGTKLVTIEQESGQQVRLFNPRTDVWDENFSLVGAEIVGLTAIGRGTARLLQMNSERRLRLSRQLLSTGEM